MADGRIAVYLSVRDRDGRARIGRTVLTLHPRPALAPLDPEPVIDLGALGAFDDSGVVTASIAARGDQRLLYYTGWALGVTVPFYLNVGVAVSDRGGPFKRLTDAPLLDRSAEDPFLTASPAVLAGAPWRMWYVSGTKWVADGARARHYYNIRYAESADGLAWRRTGHVCLDYASPGEYAFGRPCVIHEDGVYRMWYSYRGDRYRIGYAESADGCQWSRRDDAAGLEPATDGWDAGMVEYPWILDHAGRRYMLYNGDDYGRTGVGLAVWES